MGEVEMKDEMKDSYTADIYSSSGSDNPLYRGMSVQITHADGTVEVVKPQDMPEVEPEVHWLCNKVDCDCDEQYEQWSDYEYYQDR